MTRRTLTLGFSILLMGVTIACGGGTPTSPSSVEPVVVPAPSPTPAPSPEPTPAPEPAPTPSPTPAPEPAPTPSPTPAPEPTPAPTPAPSGPFTQTFTGTVDGFDYKFHDVTAPRSGTATITLRWASGADDFELYLSEAGCLIYEVGCPTFAASENSSGTVEQVSTAVAEGQVFRIWVHNFTAPPRPASYTIDVDIR